MVIDTLEQVTASIVNSLAVNITAELIERTPVDTGWARANWVPAIGAPSLAGSGDLSRSAREAGAASAGGRQSSAVGVIAAGYRDISQGPIFVSNNVPYIGRLNGGSSAQAPAGFVQDAIAAGIRSLASRRFE
ncbi:hypothetical protein P67b_00091 [Ruegeria phage Tedan]|nr:hypothetical protein P67b_00091 [Ruegeria phage Tedan]